MCSLSIGLVRLTDGASERLCQVVFIRTHMLDLEPKLSHARPFKMCILMRKIRLTFTQFTHFSLELKLSGRLPIPSHKCPVAGWFNDVNHELIGRPDLKSLDSLVGTLNSFT